MAEGLRKNRRKNRWNIITAAGCWKRDLPLFPRSMCMRCEKENASWCCAPLRHGLRKRGTPWEGLTSRSASRRPCLRWFGCRHITIRGVWEKRRSLSWISRSREGLRWKKKRALSGCGVDSFPLSLTQKTGPCAMRGTVSS